MSDSESGGGPGGREVAYRLFAAEYDDADFSYSESDEERAPNYVVTPTGARANRVFVVGVLTETEQVNDDVLRARVVDPTGAFVIYAGQYQPDELAFLERADPPAFVAVTGKARTFQPDDSDRVYTSIRPESINEVSAETRDRWTVGTAEQTLARVATMADALSREERGDDLRDALVAEGVAEGLAAGIALAIDHYGTSPTYLGAVRDLALDAARVVAGERDEVGELTTDPDAEGATTVADLLALDADLGLASGVAADAGEGAETSESTATETAEPAETTAVTDAGSSDDGGTETATTETATTETAGTGGEPSGTESADAPSSPDDPTEPASTPATESTTETAVGASSSSETAGDEPTAGGPDGAGESDEPEPATEPVDDDELGDFEPGEFDLDDDEREEIEEEYGTEFSTGTEVDEPGEADIETPDPEEMEGDAAAESDPATGSGTTADAEGESVSETTSESVDGAAAADTETDDPDAEANPDETDAADAAETEMEETDTADTDTAEADTDTAEADTTEADDPPEDVDLPDAVMSVMEDLNGDDGAPRDELIARVAEEYGASEDEVEDAIQDALMDGRCYEPDEETLKPI